MSTIKLFGKDIKVEEEEEKEKSITLFGNRIFLHDAALNENKNPHAALNENKNQKKKQKKQKHYKIFINRINLPPANLLPPKSMCMVIRFVGGSQPVYIGRKQVEQSDVSVQLSRLLITATYCTKLLNDLIGSERKKIGNQDNDTGIQVSVMDPQGNLHGMKLNRWSSLGRFVFNRGWNQLVKDNKLQKGDTLDLWHFKNPSNQPCFAINIIRNKN